MRKGIMLAAATSLMIALVVASWRSFGPRSVWFAFLVVWVPMAWLGTISRLVHLRLPAGYFALRPCEHNGRIYELAGVRVAKRLLRRGPLALFNPGLHLPGTANAPRLAELDQRMRGAEASHMMLLLGTLPVVLHDAVRGWWPAAMWTLLFDVVVNGYPVMLQRYNRAMLERRFASLVH